MATTAAYTQPATLRIRLLPGLQLILGLAVFAALALPILVTEPGALSSDESLYVSEGLNLAEGRGYTYTSGEPVVHRGPVFAALLAADFTVAGFSLDHAYWLPKLFALANVALMVALAWRFFGREAGLLAGALALASSFLLVMGTTLFLDGVQTFFLLSTLLCLHVALKHSSLPWAAGAGVALGLAVLTKESAMLWLPLPFVATLLLGRAVERPQVLLAAYAGGFLAVAGWWWPYVYAVTGQVYLLGAPGQAALSLSLAAGAILLAAAGALLLVRKTPTGLNPGSRWLAAGLVLAVWGGLFLFGLERHATWPFPQDYLRTLPEYASTVLITWLRPFPLIAVAWGYVAYRAAGGSLGDRLLVFGLLLFLPFALFAANRDLHLRDMLPLVYLSYLALARAAIDFARWLADVVGESLPAPAGGAVAAVLMIGAFGWFAISEAQRFDDYQSSFSANSVDQVHWDNPLVRDVSAWFEQNVEPGAHVMSSRLYYSQLFALTGGSYPWWQLPTVRVEFAGSPLEPVRASTLFRWEDHQMPDGPAAPWLYLRQYPEKLYYIGLSERDLLAAVEEHDIRYVVITGDDAGFSSLSLVPYFEDHPAFLKVRSFVVDGSNQAHIFLVRPYPLQPSNAPARVSESTAAALVNDHGREEAEALLEGLSAGGYELTGSYGVSAR